MTDRFSIKFSPHLVTNRVRRILFGRPGQSSGIMASWSGADLRTDADARNEFVADVCRELGDVRHSVIYSSVLDLFARSSIHPADLEDMAWRLAGNIDRLRLDMEIPPRSMLPVSPVFAPAQVTQARFKWFGNQPRPGVDMTLRILDGDLCGRSVRRWISSKFAFVVARELGVGRRRSRPWGYSGICQQLYGLRLVVRLVTSYSGDLTFDRFMAGQFVSYNRSLMKNRSLPCPAGYSWPCHECSLGEDQCPDRGKTPRACRRFSVVVSSCVVCQQEAPHDNGECLRCAARSPKDKRDAAGSKR